MGLVLIDGANANGGFLGGVSSSFGAPVSEISVNGGAQVQTVTGFNDSGQQAPIYAYVVDGIPTVQVSLERGAMFDFSGGDISAKFAVIGGTETVSANVGNTVADPTGSFSTGANGASFSFIVTDS